MRIALFDNKGYLGSQLEYAFGRASVGVDGFDLPNCNVMDESFWRSFTPAAYDAVLFFVGLTGTEQSFSRADAFLSVNELGLIRLLACLAPLGKDAPKVIFPSSRLVYKGSEQLLTEDAPKEAKTVYAASKLACEYYLQSYHERYGIPYSVVRICVPYGNLVSGHYSYGTIGFFLKQAEQGGPITLYGDGIQRRTFTHVRDFCAAVTHLMRNDANGIFNVGGGNYSLVEVARLIAQKKGIDVAFVPWPDVAQRLESGSTCFDSTKLDTLVGMGPYHDIHDMITEL